MHPEEIKAALRIKGITLVSLATELGLSRSMVTQVIHGYSRSKRVEDRIALALGKALHYLSSQWVKLERFVTSGHYPIDNNGCENSIRPFVVGRRNWLFADTVAGANASANLYSLLETCKVNGVDGYQYLRALLVALPRARTVEDYEALLPWRIAALKT